MLQHKLPCLEVRLVIKVKEGQISTWSGCTIGDVDDVIRLLVVEEYEVEPFDLYDHDDLRVKKELIVVVGSASCISNGVEVNGVGRVLLKPGEQTKDIVDDCVLVYLIVELGQVWER